MIFLRYTAIQLLAYGIDIGTFLLILFTGAVGPVGASFFAKILAGFFAFVTHRYFTFRVAEDVASRGQAIRYFVLLAINIPVALLFLSFFLLWIPEPLVAKFIADVICVGLTFLISNHFIFARPQAQLNRVGSNGADS